MATLLVVNHGSNHSRETPDYVLADFSKANENNGGVLLIDTPGFGSTAFNTKWADKERSSTKKGSFSLVQAKWYMEFVADKWFKDALVSVANTRPDVKTWAEIKKIVFVGWSRGCITTWYQIFYLQQYNKIFNYYRPKICIFNIEPCYGPSNWKSDIRAGMRYIGSGDILEEAYAVNESGMKILPGVFALYPYNQGICKRYFLPGKHSTGTIRSDESYGKNTISLYTQRLRDFLTANAPEIKLTGLPTTGGKRMDLYTEFKTSYMNRGELKYRFNRGQRMAIWPYNNAQKKTACIDKTWFFMNQQEYDLYYTLPDLRKVLSKNGVPVLDAVKRDFKNLDRIYPSTAKMISRWIKRINKFPIPIDEYGRYLKKYDSITRFLTEFY